MQKASNRSGSDLFIVDNSDGDWKVHSYLTDWCELSSGIDIATGYFEIGAGPAAQVALPPTTFAVFRKR